MIAHDRKIFFFANTTCRQKEIPRIMAHSQVLPLNSVDKLIWIFYISAPAMSTSVKPGVLRRTRHFFFLLPDVHFIKERVHPSM